jgi:hypothetical protein
MEKEVNRDRKGYEFKTIKKDNCKVRAQTIDITTLKSLFITIEFWGIRKDEAVKDELNKLFNKTKRTLYNNLNQEIFYPTYISSLDEPDNVGKYDRFFVRMEFTLFLKKPNFKTPKKELVPILNSLIDSVYNKEFEGLNWIRQKRV